LFEVGREIEKRAGETVTEYQVEDDDQSAQPAIPIEERVNGLELIMEETALYEYWDGLVLVEEALPVRQKGPDLFWWRRYEGGTVERCSW
jgi:hypothetical protein